MHSVRVKDLFHLISLLFSLQELLSKCEKGTEFYRKLETNVAKLLQRLRSVCRVQQEERDQQQAARARPIKNDLRSSVSTPVDPPSEGPKLRDYLYLMKNKSNSDNDRSTGAAMHSAPLADATPHQMPPHPGPLPTVDVGSYNYPNHRPTPLGAEQSDPGSVKYNESSYSTYPPSQYAVVDSYYQTPEGSASSSNAAFYGYYPQHSVC